jgi:thioredoxin-like negative regulator of GroEL
MNHRAIRAGLLLAVLLAGCEVGVEQSPSSVSQPAEPPVDGLVDMAPSGAVDPPSQWKPARAQAGRVARGNLKFVAGFRQGFEQASAQSKPMLLFFTAQWCHFCHQMAEEAFTNPQVVSLSEQFVCILIDADTDPGVCRQFQITGYPTIQFLSPRGVAINRIVGKQPGHLVMMAMQSALQNVARRSSETLEGAPR